MRIRSLTGEPAEKVGDVVGATVTFKITDAFCCRRFHALRDGKGNVYTLRQAAGGKLVAHMEVSLESTLGLWLLMNGKTHSDNLLAAMRRL
jgi:hypothetical protein